MAERGPEALQSLPQQLSGGIAFPGFDELGEAGKGVQAAGNAFQTDIVGPEFQIDPGKGIEDEGG